MNLHGIYGMVTGRRSNGNSDRHVARAIDGLEASRRVGWAKFYEQLERADSTEADNEALRARLATLIELLFELTDAVLRKRNVEAFAVAYRVEMLVAEFDQDNER